MNWRAVIIGAAVLALASGCGGSSSGSNVVPPDVAGAIGCTSTYKDDTTEELFVEAVGTCAFSREGIPIRILTFANNEARDNFEEVASGFGGRYFKGDNFLVEVPSPDIAEQVKNELE